MDKSLFLAMSGAAQNMRATAINANNLANISTTGFRSDFAQARAMPVFGDTHPSRVYAMTETPGTNMQHGNMQETGRDLDVAIKGQGWISVQAPDGTEAYTRAGDLQLDTNGTLRTGSGLPVIGDGGPISLPPSQTITIGLDGTISVRPLGEESSALAVIDRIKLVNPDASNLQKGSDGLMRLQDNEIATADASVGLESGFLEGSNVNAVKALTDLISLSRQFELQIKMMNNTKENSEVSARLLQIS